MATYVNDLRLKEIATGDESGTWGTSTNTNLELIAEAFSYGTEASFGSDADATTTIADGASDPARSLYLKITSGVSLTATRTLTIAPNTVSKIWIIENSTSGSQSINISQGSGANVTIPNGDVKVIYTDGAGSGAAVVDAFTDLNLGGTTTVAALDAGSGAITTTGTVTGNTLAGTLSTAAQPNITSVGTLTGFTSTGIDDNATATAITIDSSEDINLTNHFNTGNNKYVNILDADGDVSGRLRNVSGGSNSLTIEADPNNSAASTFLSFKLDADEKMRIDSSGNVGIGTTNGDVTSDGNSARTYVSIIGSANRGRLNIGTTASNGADAATLAFTNGANTLADIVVDTTSGVQNSGNLSINSTDYLRVSTAGSERMRIDSSGKVGIGVTPSEALHIEYNTVSGGDNFIHMRKTDQGAGQGAFIGIPTASNNLRIMNRASNSITFHTTVSDTERVRIDSSGNVGIGTDSPSDTLDIERATGVVSLGLQSRDSSDTKINFGDNNDGNIGIINYAHSDNSMRFTTNASERMRIESDGSLLVGKTSSGALGTTGFEFAANDTLRATKEGSAPAEFNRLITDGDIVIFYQNTVKRGSVSISGATTSYNTTSDARLKNVTGSARGLEVINKLNPVAYNWKESGKADEGLIAQEVLDIVPNAVSGSEEEMYQMDYSKLVVHLVAGMKEQQAQIDALQSEINLLKGE